jgi:hypothetical protein
MATKYFTLDEANRLLPVIEPLLAQLMEKQAEVVQMQRHLGDFLADSRSGGIGSPEASQMVQSFADIESLIGQIQSFGCVLKNSSIGLVDFLADHNGRDVYLCWKYGEAHISHYHDVHDGFNGRKPF